MACLVQVCAGHTQPFPQLLGLMCKPREVQVVLEPELLCFRGGGDVWDAQASFSPSLTSLVHVDAVPSPPWGCRSCRTFSR